MRKSSSSSISPTPSSALTPSPTPPSASSPTPQQGKTPPVPAPKPYYSFQESIFYCEVNLIC